MGSYFEYEPYVSPEQEKLWNTLNELSSKCQEMIDTKRNAALDKLIGTSYSSESKRKALNDFFLFRMEPDTCPIQLSDGKTYWFSQRREFAKTLLEDESFPYNDNYLVLNNLDPFYESITLEDIVLAYHNYRLSTDDESLSHFSKLLGLYTQYAVEMDGLHVSFPVPEGLLSHTESINHLSSIIGFVDEYLQKYYDKCDLFKDKFKLQKQSRIDFASKIDNDAAWSMGKKSPLDIRMSKLTEYIHKYGSLNDLDDFKLLCLLIDFYKQVSINNDTHKKTSPYHWPTFNDFLVLAENRAQEQKSKGNYTWQSYDNIIKALISIRDRNMIHEFNELIAVTEEDYASSKKNNDEVDTESAFDNIQMNIRLFFIIVMAVEEIPELSMDSDKNKNRKKICRKLCDIFSDEGAYENITDEKEINQERMIKSEKRIESEKSNLYKSFLMQYDLSSINSIMENRLKLLDRAKMIAPEDSDFLEDQSSKVLNLLQKMIQHENLTPFITNLRNELCLRKRMPLPDSVIHTLATAELLYTNYATDEISAQDFDYSSISALYYQAFENAYNEMIWKKYAQHLNHLVIGTTTYTSLLANHHQKQNKGIFSSCDSGYGYLPSHENDWKYYSHYDGNTKTVSVNTTCMYSSFISFIGFNKENELPQFYNWFAIELGFTDAHAMKINNSFTGLLSQFRTDMQAAINKRNNASHGGCEITKAQCSEDRKTILSDLQKVRATNLGLIQQLINMLNFIP